MSDGLHTAGEASGKKAVLPPCRYCGAEFSYIGAMRDHKRRKVHEEHEAGNPIHLWCEICDLDFRTRDGVGLHIREMHGEEQNLTCPGCSSHFVRLSGFVKHIELDECPTLRLGNIEDRMRQRVLMTKALSNVDKLSKEDATTHHEKSFYQHLGHDPLPAPAWWQTDDKPSPWPMPVEQTWGYQDRTATKDEDSSKLNRPVGNDGEDTWAKNENSVSNKPTAEQLRRLQDDQQAAAERERERRPNIAGPNSPMFNAEEFWNQYSRRYKCPHQYCMKSFPKKSAFVQHLRSAHRSNDISCPTCQKHFGYLFALAAHVESQSRRCHMRESTAYGWFLNQLTWGTAEVAGRHDDYTLKYQVQKGFQEDFGPKKTTRPTYGHQQVHGTASGRHPQLTAGALAQQQQEMKNSSKQSMPYGQQQQQQQKQGGDAGRVGGDSVPLTVEALSRLKLQEQQEPQGGSSTKAQTPGNTWDYSPGNTWDYPSGEGWGPPSKTSAPKQRVSFWNEPPQLQAKQEEGNDAWNQQQGGYGARKGGGYMW